MEECKKYGEGYGGDGGKQGERINGRKAGMEREEKELLEEMEG